MSAHPQILAVRAGLLIGLTLVAQFAPTAARATIIESPSGIIHPVYTGGQQQGHLQWDDPPPGPVGDGTWRPTYATIFDTPIDPQRDFLLLY